MIIQVYDEDLLNGAGLREVAFFQGCPHHCKNCFNSETWEFKKDTPESIDKSARFIIQIKNKLKEPYIDGITLSGGDPLAPQNLKEALFLATTAKSYGKTVWAYTGYTWEYLIKSSEHQAILKYIDVLCEGPFIEKLKSPDKPWVGSSNQRVINVIESLKNNKIIEING